MMQDSLESYEAKRRRMEELPDIIHKALVDKDKDAFMSATDELKQLREFFKEARKASKIKMKKRAGMSAKMNYSDELEYYDMLDEMKELEEEK